MLVNILFSDILTALKALQILPALRVDTCLKVPLSLSTFKVSMFVFYCWSTLAIKISSICKAKVNER